MVEEILAGIEDPEVREYIYGVVGVDPKFLALVKQKEDSRYNQSISPPWCRCNMCRQMPTSKERKCCGQKRCKTFEPGVRNVCLNSQVVATAINSDCDTMVRTPKHDNRNMRHAAYRQYVMHEYGHLGKGNRVVIPSCVVWMIRDKWPSHDGNYTGFKEAK